MATRPTTPRKPSVRATSVRTTPAAKATTVKVATPQAATKTPVRRTASPVVRKPVSAIIAKNLKPVVAKNAATVAKTKPVVVTKPVTKPKKIKLVRATFSFPDHEHALLVELKKRAKKLGKEFKKSEILRAGIAHLVALADSALVSTLSKVERVKTGRPAKKAKKK